MSAAFTSTPAQQQVWRFITGYLEAHDGISPTFQEIRLALGIGSRQSVSDLLDRLEERGVLTRLRLHQRAIALIVTPQVPRAPDGAPLYFISIEHLNRGARGFAQVHPELEKSDG